VTAVVLNGDAVELHGEPTVCDAVKAAGAPERGVAVAVDGEVVSRGAWGRTSLSDGQSVEVLQAVQGG